MSMSQPRKKEVIQLLYYNILHLTFSLFFLQLRCTREFKPWHNEQTPREAFPSVCMFCSIWSIHFDLVANAWVSQWLWPCCDWFLSCQHQWQIPSGNNIVCPVKSLVSIVFCFCIVLHVLLDVTKVPFKSTTLGKFYEFLAYL